MPLDTPVKRSPGIGLTPLIDVVFILLIFFMLATRFSVLQESPLQLNSTGAAGAQERVITLKILGPDRIEAGGRMLAFDGLSAWLAEQSGRRLVVVPADDVALQTTVDVMARIEASGHDKLDVALLEAR